MVDNYPITVCEQAAFVAHGSVSLAHGVVISVAFNVKSPELVVVISGKSFVNPATYVAK